MKNLTDTELILKSINDPVAFGVIYDRHWRWIHVWFARRVHNRDLAFDLTLEAFGQALRDRKKFRKHETSDSAGPWLFGIANNRLRDWQRAKRKENFLVNKLEETCSRDEDDQQEHLLQRLSTEQWHAELHDALSTLAPEYQEAIALRVVAEWSYDQIGKRLDCSPDLIRQRVSRGLKQMRKHFYEKSKTPEKTIKTEIECEGYLS